MFSLLPIYMTFPQNSLYLIFYPVHSKSLIKTTRPHSSSQNSMYIITSSHNSLQVKLMTRLLLKVLPTERICLIIVTPEPHLQTFFASHQQIEFPIYEPGPACFLFHQLTMKFTPSCNKHELNERQ